MPEEAAKHADVKMIPQEQFEQMKTLYFYASHRMLKFIALIQQAQRAYDAQGNLLYGKKRPEIVSFPREQIEEMESLIVDLEDRLDKMFLRHGRLVEQREEARKNKEKIPRKVAD